MLIQVSFQMCNLKTQFSRLKSILTEKKISNSQSLVFSVSFGVNFFPPVLTSAAFLCSWSSEMAAFRTFTLLWCQLTCLAQPCKTLRSTSYLYFIGILSTESNVKTDFAWVACTEQHSLDQIPSFLVGLAELITKRYEYSFSLLPSIFLPSYMHTRQVRWQNWLETRPRELSVAYEL